MNSKNKNIILITVILIANSQLSFATDKSKVDFCDEVYGYNASTYGECIEKIAKIDMEFVEEYSPGFYKEIKQQIDKQCKLEYQQALSKALKDGGVGSSMNYVIPFCQSKNWAKARDKVIELNLKPFYLESR
ncbi:MAG: hypothetical protein EOM46_12655 [Gammaproteobacteria bacterium]|nr:hypothetical protein [Gammaproteobacteria bacterium]